KLEYSATLQLKRLRLLDDGTIFTGESAGMRYDRNTFTIEFESICFNFQHDIAYQYMLEGYDAEWSLPSQRQEVQYTNIRPGRYTFRVRGISRHDGRILDEKVMAIKVARPWWNSVYAWIFYLSMLSATILLAWRYFYSRVERRYFDEKIDFFIHTAHDIRTPLSLVLAPLEDLGRNGSLDEDGKRYLSIARRNGDKLMSMIGRLLDFQKSDLTGTPLRMQIFNLRTILTSVVEKFVPLASQKTISLTLDSCPDDCLIKADGELIDKVMDNLVSNAIKYTGSGGEVHISAWAKPRTVYIEVADNGIGIPLKAQKNIFQRFYRADNAVNMQETGSGIGLLLSRRLVQLHGGFLSFRSSEGEGTVFRISLPLEAAADSVEPPIPAETQQLETIRVIVPPTADETQEIREQTDCDTILFVDDNEELCSYVRLSFRSFYNVVTYTNPLDALQYLRDGGICDILVSDVMMPEMPGDELCRSIKENPETQWLPVILLTARSGRDFMIEGLGKGADDYVVKPFDPAILRSRIETLLANRRRLSSYYLDRSAELTRDGMSAEANPEIGKGASEADRLFVDKATRTVIEHIADVEFSVDTFCREMAMSRTLLYGRLKTLTSHSPQDFIRFIRLEKAASLLREGTSVMDVSIMTGFVNSKHFSTVFKRQYGISPSRFCQN
ncbi:MAG: response regulator, partial [Bacteroidales bacterium]|nr:response regulator [Bacteroidales bacterium]